MILKSNTFLTAQMPRVLFAVLAATLTILFFTACGHSSKDEHCQELDWYELGRRDGIKGKDIKNRREVKAVCEGSDQSLSEALYNNGFDAGVAQYCTPENGFELGRSGRELSNICPPLLQEEFEQFYQKGHRYSELERQQSEINTRLKNIEGWLGDKSINVARRGLLSGEKLHLEEKKRSIDFEIGSLKPQRSENKITH